MSKSLQDLMAEFEAKGGEVKEVAIGATALVGIGLPPLTFTNHDADRRDRAKERRLKLQSHTREDDLALVAIIHQLKGVARSNIELYRAMSCTNDRLQRILRDYLEADETVDRFRAMSREDRTERDNRLLLAAVKEQLAQGVKGTHAIGRACGTSAQRISALAQRYKLTIPRGDPNLREPGRVQIAVSQLQRWADYIKEDRLEDVEREIQNTIKRGSNDAP